MAEYIDHPESFADAGTNAQRYFQKHFTLDIFTDRLERLMKDMVT